MKGNTGFSLIAVYTVRCYFSAVPPGVACQSEQASVALSYVTVVVSFIRLSEKMETCSQGFLYILEDKGVSTAVLDLKILKVF